jgi:hypothetical protein
MPAYVKGTPATIACFVEYLVRATGWFECVYNGKLQQDFKNGGSPTFYTKVYRMKLDGEYQRFRVRLIYNERDKLASVEGSWKEFMDLNKKLSELIKAKEALITLPTQPNQEEPKQ